MARDQTELKARLEFKRQALTKAREAYLAILDGGVSSYSLGSRSATKLELEKLKAQIDSLEKEVDALEAELNGGKARKAVGVVLEDW